MRHNAYAPAPQASTVEVFTTKLPQRPYREIGILRGRQTSALSMDDLDGVLRKMRQEAAVRGCEGLIITGAADEVVHNAQGQTATLEGLQGTCITYTDGRRQTPPPRIARTWDAKGYWRLRTEWARGTLRFVLAAAPKHAPGTASLTLTARRRQETSTKVAAPAYAECAFGLVRDDQPLPLGATVHEADRLTEVLAAEVDLSTLKLASTGSSSLFVCNDEFVLTPDEQATLAQFVAKFEAERDAP